MGWYDGKVDVGADRDHAHRYRRIIALDAPQFEVVPGRPIACHMGKTDFADAGVVDRQIAHVGFVTRQGGDQTHTGRFGRRLEQWNRDGEKKGGQSGGGKTAPEGWLCRRPGFRIAGCP